MHCLCVLYVSTHQCALSEVQHNFNPFMLASLCVTITYMMSDSCPCRLANVAWLAGIVSIAFRKYSGVEYVMDYILERKRVDDLHQSIKDRRYDKQK